MQQSTGQGGGPVVHPTNGKVKLVAKGARNGSSIEWSLDTDENGPPSGKVTRVDVAGGSGPCQVTIKIKMDNPDVTFDQSSPLSASEAGCPPAHSGIASDQIDAHSIAVESNGKQLTFTDVNTRQADIYYTLCFVGAEPFDPMIRNR